MDEPRLNRIRMHSYPPDSHCERNFITNMNPRKPTTYFMNYTWYVLDSSESEQWKNKL